MCIRDSFLPQYLATNESVADIRLLTHTEDAWRVTPANADVVEHGGLLDEAAVYLQFGMCVDDAQRLEGYAAAVHHEDVLQLILDGIILVYDFIVVQRSFEG